MKILSLNCQGLGNTPIARAFLNLRRQRDLDVMFLSETHLDIYPTKNLRQKLNMDCKIVNPSNGKSGGVLLFRQKDIKVEQKNWRPNTLMSEFVRRRTKFGG
jgi:exonuclease III